MAPRAPFNPKLNAHMSVDEYEDWRRQWRHSLIVRLLGKKVSLNFLTNKLNNLWAREDTIQVLDLRNDFFMERFKQERDYTHALFEGPWLVLDYYLLVQRWHPLFQMSNQHI